MVGNSKIMLIETDKMILNSESVAKVSNNYFSQIVDSLGFTWISFGSVQRVYWRDWQHYFEIQNSPWHCKNENKKF